MLAVRVRVSVQLVGLTTTPSLQHLSTPDHPPGGGLHSGGEGTDIAHHLHHHHETDAGAAAAVPGPAGDRLPTTASASGDAQAKGGKEEEEEEERITNEVGHHKTPALLLE